MSLVLFTCMVGLLIAPYSVDLKTSLISLLAVAIGSGAAGALNMWYESDVDALMSRTCLRPIPTGKVKRNQACSTTAAFAGRSRRAERISSTTPASTILEP